MNPTMKLLRGRHQELQRPVLLSTVSGVASTRTQLIRYFDREAAALSMITTKSFQVTVNPGNREPVICETEAGVFGNSVGLRNPGLDQALYELEQLRKAHPMRTLLNVSLSANTIEDFIILVKAFDEVADLVELNFSCPHVSAGYGAAIGSDADIASDYVRRIKAETSACKAPLFIKLTPNVEDIGSIAQRVMEAGADGLVAINTVGPIVHIDPESKTPILQNHLGGQGGLSGKAVYADALDAIRKIRSAVGPSVPLIGMGGVFTADQVAEMVRAGSDIVGIGSALGCVDQRHWPAYLGALKSQAEAILTDGPTSDVDAGSFLIKERQMAYVRHTVTRIEPYGASTAIITLDGTLAAKAGEFAFLWLPQVGEKPFSVAHNEPLTFIVKQRGPFSKALCALEVGDDLYIRGLYGAELENRPTEQALLVGGGTGVAVLPSLAQKLQEQGTAMTILIGTSEKVEGKALLEDELSVYGSFHCIPDEGRPGRVLDLIDEIELASGQAAYLVGPEIFMAIAARKLLARGLDEENLYLSMERMTLCGIGMCGECACGERLTCRWGTFMNWAYLVREAPELIAYD